MSWCGSSSGTNRLAGLAITPLNYTHPNPHRRPPFLSISNWEDNTIPNFQYQVWANSQWLQYLFVAMRWKSKVPTVHRWQNATQVHDFDRYVGSEIRGLTAPKAAPKDGCELTKKHGGLTHGHGELIEFKHQKYKFDSWTLDLMCLSFEYVKDIYAHKWCWFNQQSWMWPSKTWRSTQGKKGICVCCSLFCFYICCSFIYWWCYYQI